MKKIITSFILVLCLFLLASCDNKEHQLEETLTLKKEKAYTFEDGEYVNLWNTNHFSQDIYKLTNDTTLLRVNTPIKPANSYVIGMDGIDDLCEEAQQEIIDFYEKQGLLYNIETELKKAYSEYLDCKSNDKTFDDFYLSQDIAPTASNDSIICFITSALIPINGDMCDEIRLVEVFDRQTGEVLNKWDLFCLPEDETIKKLLELSQISDEKELAEIEKALKPKNILLFDDCIELSFERGTLQSEENNYSIILDYEDLDGIINTWAVPNCDNLR